jgi:hypothetical protein
MALLLRALYTIDLKRVLLLRNRALKIITFLKAPINLQGRGHPAKQAQKKSKSPKKLSLTELLEKTIQGSLKNVPMGASDIHNKGEVKPKSSFLIVRRATLPPFPPYPAPFQGALLFYKQNDEVSRGVSEGQGGPYEVGGGKRNSLKQKASAKPSLRTKRVQNTAVKKVVS